MARDLQQLHSALRNHLIAGERLTGVTRLAAGHTNETYRLEGLGLVLRMPPSGPPLLEAHDMARQFQLYAVVGRLDGAPPVPRVVYWCDDPTVLGAPFYLMEYVEGFTFPEYDEPAWLTEPPDAFREALCGQYVRAFAGAANLPLIQMLGPVRSGAEELAHWRRSAVDAGARELVSMMDALIAIGGRCSGPPGVVHGDPKLGNTLWLDGRLRAVLDWEMAFNGDPLNDLGYMLYFFQSEAHPPQINCDRPGMWSRERIIAEWERVTGRSAAGHEWYEAAGAAKIAAIMAYGHHLALTGQSADERLAAWGPYVEASVAMTERLIQSVGRN